MHPQRSPERLAATIDADQLLAWKAQYPGAVVVSYVNTTAEVKALSDYCCTSSNAEAVIRSIPSDREILFCPDMFLGAHLERVTGRKLHVWMGECHVHAGIVPDRLDAMRRDHPDAELLIHPECGCTSSTLYRMSSGDISGPATVVTSTEGMVRRAAESPASTFIVATEVGILHRMQEQSPMKRFLAASEAAVCPYMKKITLEKVARSLERMAPRVEVDPVIAAHPARSSATFPDACSSVMPVTRPSVWTRQSIFTTPGVDWGGFASAGSTWIHRLWVRLSTPAQYNFRFDLSTAERLLTTSTASVS